MAYATTAAAAASAVHVSIQDPANETPITPPPSTAAAVATAAAAAPALNGDTWAVAEMAGRPEARQSMGGGNEEA